MSTCRALCACRTRCASVTFGSRGALRARRALSALCSRDTLRPLRSGRTDALASTRRVHDVPAVVVVPGRVAYRQRGLEDGAVYRRAARVFEPDGQRDRCGVDVGDGDATNDVLGRRRGGGQNRDRSRAVQVGVLHLPRVRRRGVLGIRDDRRGVGRCGRTAEQGLERLSCVRERQHQIPIVTVFRMS